MLRTVPGAVDYLAEEVRHLDGVVVRGRRTDALIVELDGPLSTLADCPYFMSAAIPFDKADAESLAESGVMSAFGGPVRFRVGDIGESRWPLRDGLGRLGWVNDPGDWHVNIEPDDSGIRMEIGGLYWTQRFGELLRAPASANPVIAAVMVRLAKLAVGQTLFDPFCGAGTLLVAGTRLGVDVTILGADHDRRWVSAAVENMSRQGGLALVWQGDAGAVPLLDGSVDRIVSNLPFGKRVGSHRGNQVLYPRVLGQAARLLTPKGRAVFLTEDKRLFAQTVQQTRGLRVIKEVKFATGGAHPSAYVVTTRRTR